MAPEGWGLLAQFLYSIGSTGRGQFYEDTGPDLTKANEQSNLVALRAWEKLSKMRDILEFG